MAKKQTTFSTGAVTLTTTTETVAALSTSLPTSGDDVSINGVRISGVVNVTAGTAATGVVIKVRRTNAITGTQVGGAGASQTHTLAAGATANIPYDMADGPPGTLEDYCVTVTQVAATGNGTVNSGSITVESGTY